MQQKTIVERVEMLEKTVESLASLPAQVARLTDRVSVVESQIVQLRGEMADGFSATRTEILEVVDASAAASQRMFDELRTSVSQAIGASAAETRQLIVEGDAETRRLVIEETHRLIVGGDAETRRLVIEETHRLIVGGDEATRVQMRVLHEEIIDRLKVLGDARRP